MRDVGNHESRSWTWRDLLMDPVIWLATGGLVLCLVILILMWGEL